MHVILPFSSDSVLREPQDCLEEMATLCHFSGLLLRVVEKRVVRVRRPTAYALIGRGHLSSLRDLVEREKISVLCLDADISPLQQRNLERELSCRVIDRVGLILEIFALNAKSQEGRLQVSRAECEWQRSRLVQAWQHLERQRGGRGFLSGPGERQIEIDRRLLDKRSRILDERIKKLKRNRDTQRRFRRSCHLIALTGYTNSGKSTLFNRLLSLPLSMRQDTRKQPFLTLDTKIKRLRAGVGPGHRTLLLADTVGFIMNLPHFLFESFTATLEEVVHADTILHVRDISAANSGEQKHEVLRVLKSLGCRGRIIEVWNKIDALSEKSRISTLASSSGCEAHALSALTGEGCAGLQALFSSFE